MRGSWFGQPDGTRARRRSMEGTSSQRKRLPPRWFIRFAWAVRRAIAPAHRWATRPVAGQARALGNDETDDRRPQDREDAQRDPQLLRGWSNLVTMAMNGWGAPEPAWWLNLQAQPNAQVELKSGTRAVRGRAAGGDGASASGRGSASSAMTRTTTRTGDRGGPKWWCSSRRARPPRNPTRTIARSSHRDLHRGLGVAGGLERPREVFGWADVPGSSAVWVRANARWAAS